MRRYRIKERMVKLGHLDPSALATGEDGRIPLNVSPDEEAVSYANQFISFNDYVRAVNGNTDGSGSGNGSSRMAGSDGSGGTGIEGGAAEEALVRLRRRQSLQTNSNGTAAVRES